MLYPQLYAQSLRVSHLMLSLHCFQAPPVLPSFLITKLASAVAWQTSTNTSWWQTTWTGATAGCYRNFPVNSAAPGGERKSSAPWTAARAKLRHRRRCGDFFHLQLDPRTENLLNLKMRNATAQSHLFPYRVKTQGSHLETNRLRLLWRPH